MCKTCGCGKAGKKHGKKAMKKAPVKKAVKKAPVKKAPRRRKGY